MASHELALIVKAIDQASATLQTIGGEVSSLGASATSTAQELRPLGLGLAAVGAAGTGLISAVTLSAARTEVLGTVLETVGANAGYTAAELAVFEEAVKSQGITTKSARQALILMMQAKLDLTDATQLATLAQDAAVVANTNSSQAYEGLIEGISKGRTIILRSMGLNVDFAGSYERMAEQLGITALELTNEQKMQARLNEVLERGTTIAGSYNAAMGDVGKQMTSLPRLTETAGEALGVVYLPALSEAVEGVSELLKAFIALEPEQQETIANFIAGGTAVAALGGGAILVIPKIVALGSSVAALGPSLAALGGFIGNTTFGLQLLAAGASTSGLGVAGLTATAVAGAAPLAALAAAMAGVMYVANQIPESMKRSTESIVGAGEASVWFEGTGAKLQITEESIIDTSYRLTDVVDGLTGSMDRHNERTERAVPLTDGWASSLDQLTEAVELGSATLIDYTDQLNILQLSVSGPVGEANEKYAAQQEAINQKLTDAKARLQELDPVQDGYTQSVVDTKGEIYNLQDELLALDATHREVMARIVYDMMVARLATDGWTSDEVELSLEVARGMGIIDHDTWMAATSMNAALDSFYQGGSVAGTKLEILNLSNDLVGLGPVAHGAGQELSSGLQPGIGALDTLRSRAEGTSNAIGRISREVTVNIRYNDPGYHGPGPQQYQHGTDYVPSTGLAFLHKGEAVIPAAQNREGRAGTTPPVVIHNHFGAGSVRSAADIRAIANAMQHSLELQGVRGRIS